MSRNSKNATRKAQAKAITAMHLRGEKGAARTQPKHGKKNSWWSKFRSYSEFIKGGSKAKGGRAQPLEVEVDAVEA